MDERDPARGAGVAVALRLRRVLGADRLQRPRVDDEARISARDDHRAERAAAVPEVDGRDRVAPDAQPGEAGRWRGLEREAALPGRIHDRGRVGRSVDGLLVDDENSDRGRVDLGHTDGTDTLAALEFMQLDPGPGLQVREERDPLEEERRSFVGRLDVDELRVARIAERVVVPGAVGGPAGPVIGAVQDDALVAGLLELEVVRSARTERVPGVLQRGGGDVPVRDPWLHTAIHERLTACECGRVHLRLEMPLQDVPVARAHHHGADREDHRNEERKEDDDLTELRSHAGLGRAQHDATSPVMSVGFCSSRIVAVAVSVTPTLFTNQNLYGAVSLTFTGSPLVASFGLAIPG